MEKSRQFNQEQKLVILESAKEVGIMEASRIAGVHYRTVYEWRNRLEVLGRVGLLSYCSESRGRGIKQVTEDQEKAVLDTWERYPGFGPSQVRNQLRRQGVRNEASFGEYNPKRFKRQILFSRIKLQTPVWRCSGCPKGSSSLVAKDAPGSCRGSFTGKYFLTGIYLVDMETRRSFCCKKFNRFGYFSKYTK